MAHNQNSIVFGSRERQNSLQLDIHLRKIDIYQFELRLQSTDVAPLNRVDELWLKF